MDTRKEEIRHILQICFDKGENKTVNHPQIFFCQLRCENFVVKDSPHPERQFVENIKSHMNGFHRRNAAEKQKK